MSMCCQCSSPSIHTPKGQKDPSCAKCGHWIDPKVIEARKLIPNFLTDKLKPKKWKF